MIKLDKKYVLHIPLCKYVGGELIEIEIDNLLDDLLSQLFNQGFTSLYITHIESYYKKRTYEILITIFCGNDSPIDVFTNWFKINNSILKQESFAYELNNSLIIENLM